MIVKETLAYADFKKTSDFTEFYVEELQAYTGIHIAMGLLKLPHTQDYWCTNEIISTPWFGLQIRTLIDHLSAVFPVCITSQAVNYQLMKWRRYISFYSICTKSLVNLGSKYGC